MKLLVYREGAEKVETGFTADQLPELLKRRKDGDLDRHGGTDSPG
jgi:hypothetical protein